MKKEFLTSGQLMEAVRKLDYKVQGMITIKDLNDIAENKIKNDAQKAIIRESENQGDRNFYTHYRHNIFSRKSLLMCSVT